MWKKNSILEPIYIHCRLHSIDNIYTVRDNGWIMVAAAVDLVTHFCCFSNPEAYTKIRMISVASPSETVTYDIYFFIVSNFN